MRMRNESLVPFLCVAVVVLAGLVIGPAVAHFQMLIPSRDVVSADDPKTITLDLLFAHPMEGDLMQMAKPKAFGVSVKGGEPVDLLGTLEEKKAGGHSTWTTSYRIERPGDYVFYVEPAPYWEPAEDCFIIHYAKVVVNAFGLEEGWDAELGLKTEIVPLVRPYGLWAGNVFRGIVKLDGKPVPYAEIEVEYYNEPGKPRVEPPTDAHITQVVKANAQGEFTYAMPRAGWWGFAALSEADYTIAHEGEEKAVELGAVIWVHTDEMK
jgi:cobalt/nickel transport protein